MTINTFVMSGEVKRVDVSKKQAKRGAAAVIMVQYGPSRQRTDQPVQFLNLALIRVPPYVYEKSGAKLKVGCLVDIAGHVQGVLKHVLQDAFVSNELVVDRLQVVDDADEEELDHVADAALGETLATPATVPM